MKTAKIFSVLSFALIFATATTVYSKDRMTDNPKQINKVTIRYEVTVHLSSVLNLCNTYLVKITDEQGRPVAHPQVFVPGVSKYVFTESISVQAKIRVASLALPENIDPYFCPTNLNTKSEPMWGPFFPGQTYSFDLYPIIEKGAVKGN
jgi:hypothetical protein